MKKFIIFLVTILFIIPSIEAAGRDSTNIEAQEVYFAFHPLDQYIEVIEYNLVIDSKDEKEINNSIQNLNDKIKKAEYSVSKYKFKYFKPVEEKITNEKKFIKGHYHLLTQEKNIIDLLTDVLENILRTEVKVELTQKEIKAYFNGKGIKVANNNALGFYSRDDDRLIVWKNGVPKFEMVVSFEVEGKTPLLEYISQAIVSPKKTKEEIDQIKNESPELIGVLQDFQDDADIYRLHHIKYYGGLIEDYKEKMGKFPFEGEESVPIYVFIVHDQQEKYTLQENPNPHKTIELKRFINELEKGIGRNINQYYDPQYVPRKKPNSYIYMVRDSEYFFAVHISRYYNFSTKVSDHYYKVEISNHPPQGSNIQTYSSLINNPTFIRLINKVPCKDGLFKKREREYIDFIK